MSTFQREIEDFANMFVAMQIKRHAADYDPVGSYAKSAVLQDIDDAEAVVREFQAVPIRDRRAFAANVLFKSRA